GHRAVEGAELREVVFAVDPRRVALRRGEQGQGEGRRREPSEQSTHALAFFSVPPPAHASALLRATPEKAIPRPIRPIAASASGSASAPVNMSRGGTGVAADSPAAMSLTP